MIVYLLMTVFSAFFMLICSRAEGYNIWGEEMARHRKKKRIVVLFFILSAFVIYLVMALRYDVGTDYLITYVRRFRLYRNPENYKVAWEPIYKYLFILLGKICGEQQVVFFITSALIVIPIWIGIKKMSPMPWFSVILFVISRHFFISMNGVRQYTALAFVLIAFSFIPEKCFWKYALFVIIGAMCHYSVIIFLPLYILIYLDISPVVSVLSVGVLSIISPAIVDIARKILSFTPYVRYLGSKYDTADRYNIWSYLVILFTFIISILIVQKEPIGKDEHLLRFLFNLNIISTWFSFNLYLVPNGERISWSLDFPILILYPLLIMRIKDKTKRVLLIAATTVLMAFVAYIRLYVMHDHAVFPYKVFFIESL